MIYEIAGVIALFVGFYAGIVFLLNAADKGQGRLLEEGRN